MIDFEERNVHILTKVLVVFAAVLSIFLAALTIAYSSNANAIAQSLAGEQALREEASSALNIQVSQARTEMAVKEDRIKKLEGDIAQRDADRNRDQTEIARLLSEKNKAETSRQSIESKISELGALADTQAKMISSYREEVTTLRNNEIDFRKKSLDLEARLSDLESQREVLQSTVRALQEQLTEAKLAQDSSSKGGSSASGPGGVIVPNGVAIRGKVDRVSVDPGSKATLATINVGSNDQVRDNMKLMIVRDNNFIANLIVVRTDLKWSVGRIETLAKGSEVRQGDQVLSEIR